MAPLELKPYAPTRYLREVVVEVSVGCFDFLHPKDRSYSIRVTDPEYKNGEPIWFTIPEDLLDESILNKCWTEWLYEAMKIFTSRSFSSESPNIRQWIADWHASTLVDDSMELVYGYGYALKHLNAAEERAAQALAKAQRLKQSRELCEQSLRELDAEREAAKAVIKVE